MIKHDKVGFLLVAVLAITMAFPCVALAAEFGTNDASGIKVIATISHTGNAISCQGKVYRAISYTVNITVTLQKKNEHNAWDNCHAETGYATEKVSFVYIASSGSYRTKVFATFYDSNGKLIGTTTSYSDEITL